MHHRLHADLILENGDPNLGVAASGSVVYCGIVLSLLGQVCSLRLLGWRDYNINRRGHMVHLLSESTASFCHF